MAKKEKIYCVYCGTENVLVEKKCKKCKKQLDPKNRPVYDYLKDKVDGTLQDNIFSIITNFIQTHLYGTVLTCSVVITAVSIVTNVVSNSNVFEVVKERPNIVQRYEYAGAGMTPDEITNTYIDALNSGDLNTLKLYELGTFYPELYEELENVSYNAAGYGETNILKEHNLYTNRGSLFSSEYGYQIGSSYGCIPDGNYGDYRFVRYPIFNTFCYEGDCEKEDNLFAIVNDIELLEVDGNYYVTGSIKEIGMSIDQEVNYEFLLRNNGDVTQFSKQDVDDYIMSLE